MSVWMQAAAAPAPGGDEAGVSALCTERSQASGVVRKDGRQCAPRRRAAWTKERRDAQLADGDEVVLASGVAREPNAARLHGVEEDRERLERRFRVLNPVLSAFARLVRGPPLVCDRRPNSVDVCLDDGAHHPPAAIPEMLAFRVGERGDGLGLVEEVADGLLAVAASADVAVVLPVGRKRLG